MHACPFFDLPNDCIGWKALSVGNLAGCDRHHDFRMRMKDDQLKFLSLLDHQPARFSVEQTAWALNFQDHDIPILILARLLKPLGNPPPNGVKYFAAVEIGELARDRQWLARATNAIHQHWHAKNRRKTGPMPRSMTGANNPRAAGLRSNPPANGEE